MKTTRYILDTHAFYWFDNGSRNLSQVAREIIADRSLVRYISIASIWEIQIKLQTGKLKLRAPLSEIVRDQQEQNGIELLGIKPAHVYELASLPSHHRDPFDRLLVAQARIEKIALLSSDENIAKYPVTVVW